VNSEVNIIQFSEIANSATIAQYLNSESERIMSISSATHAISVNPATGETLSATPWASREDVDAALELAASGYRQWRQKSIAERAQVLRAVGAVLRRHGEAMAQLISQEMGKKKGQADNPGARRSHQISQSVRLVRRTRSVDAGFGSDPGRKQSGDD